jgi:hypothetical protein
LESCYPEVTDGMRRCPDFLGRFLNEHRLLARGASIGAIERNIGWSIEKWKNAGA